MIRRVSRCRPDCGRWLRAMGEVTRTRCHARVIKQAALVRGMAFRPPMPLSTLNIRDVTATYVHHRIDCRSQPKLPLGGVEDLGSTP